MIRIFCDRCGRDMTDEPAIGIIALNSMNNIDTCTIIDENEFEGRHYCAACMAEIRAVVGGKPAPAREEPAKEEPAAEKKPSKASKPAEPRTKIDIGKILSLRNAGWAVKEIASDMGLSPHQVSQALNRYKRKLQKLTESKAKWEEEHGYEEV